MKQRLMVQIESRMYDDLRRMAYDRKCSVASVVRDALETYIAPVPQMTFKIDKDMLAGDDDGKRE